MKPIHIDFVARNRWRWIWMGTALAIAAMLMVAGMQWQSYQTQRSQVLQTQQALGEQIAALERPVKPITPAQAKLREQVLAHLHRDLNPVFATVEGMQFAGVQLRSLNLDTGSGTVRLEYMLSGMDQASLVSDKLNAGYEKKPWVLTGVVMNGGSASGGKVVVSGGVVGGNGGSPNFTGVWTAGIQGL